MATILTTTGISLHSNTKKELKINQPPTEEQMREYLHRDPTSASAEANSLLHIAQPGDSIILLHTDTSEAKQCADLIQEFFLEKKDYKPYQVQVKKLQLREDEKHIETHGLRNLVNEIDQILRSNNDDVIINATAGFKLEIIYSTIIGMLHQVPIKYLHEKFSRIVTLNPVALGWDMTVFFNNSVFFEWLNKPKPQREVEERLQNSFERQKIEMLLTPPNDDGNISLSPLGETLQLSFMYTVDAAEKADWPPEVQVKNIETKIASSIINHGHDYPKWTKDTCKKIARIPYVQIIIPEHFNNVSHSKIAHMYDNGSMIVYLTGEGKDNGKAARLKIQTTAQDFPQTLKVAKLIQEILEKP